MKTTGIALATAMALLLGGCQNMQDNPKQTVGTVVGAGTGALLGSKIGGGRGAMAATAVGALAGAFLGSEIGKSLDNADKAVSQRTAQTALETGRTGQTTSWRNPDSGNSGTYTPTSTYRSPTGEDCREFEQTINVGGRSEKAMGRACRQPNGTWQIVQ